MKFCTLRRNGHEALREKGAYVKQFVGRTSGWAVRCFGVFADAVGAFMNDLG